MGGWLPQTAKSSDKFQLRGHEIESPWSQFLIRFVAFEKPQPEKWIRTGKSNLIFFCFWNDFLLGDSDASIGTKYEVNKQGIQHFLPFSLWMNLHFTKKISHFCIHYNYIIYQTNGLFPQNIISDHSWYASFSEDLLQNGWGNLSCQ